MDCILFSIFYCILIYIFCIFCILKYILNNIVDILFCISQGTSAALNRISAALIMGYTYFAYFAYFAYSWQNNCLERLECIIAWFPMTRPSYWCTTTYIHFQRPLIYRRRHLEIPKILLASQGIIPVVPTGTSGSRPSIDDTGTTYRTWADSLRSFTMEDWHCFNHSV